MALGANEYVQDGSVKVSMDTTVGLHRTAAAEARDAELGLKIKRPDGSAQGVRGQECVRTLAKALLYVFPMPGL